MTTTEGAELLPCPWCQRPGTVEDFSDPGKPLFGAGCWHNDCPVESYAMEATEAKAITAWNTRSSTEAQQPPATAVVEREVEAVNFRPIDTWDRRDDPVLLLVDYTNGDHALEDATVAVTIGHNNDHNVGEGEGSGWEFAGWCWTHDHYGQGKGAVIGWLPITNSRALLSTPKEERKSTP